MNIPHPIIRLQAGRSKRLRTGHPWVFSNEVDMNAATKALPPGGIVALQDAGGEFLGMGSFNPHSLIAFRLFDRDPTREADSAFFHERLSAALSLRDMLYADPCYRLVHSEADRLPGLIVDRYGDVVAAQVNTAGMDRLRDCVLDALELLLGPRAILLGRESPIRKLEGLELEPPIVRGTIDGPVELVENGAHFLADLTEGQKTGWFYDQRDNRAFVARLAKDRHVLDLYTYAGGFAIQAALAGASAVVAVDRSEASLALARRSAERNAVPLELRRAEAFAEMESMARGGERFGLVIADPPAFVKSRKDLSSGLKGYRKMVRLAAPLVEPGGFLLAASCSHHVTPEAFAEEVAHGLSTAGRNGRVLRQAGAAPDHPVHPHLPESAYLKAIVLQLD